MSQTGGKIWCLVPLGPRGIALQGIACFPALLAFLHCLLSCIACFPALLAFPHCLQHEPIKSSLLCCTLCDFCLKYNMKWYNFRFDVVFSGIGAGSYNTNRHFTWIHVVFRRKCNMKLHFIDIHVVRLAENQPSSLIGTNPVRGGSRRTFLPVLPYGR